MDINSLIITWIIFVLALSTIGLIVFVLYKFKMAFKNSNLSFLSVVPIFGKFWKSRAINIQDRLAKDGVQYCKPEMTQRQKEESFISFISSLPTYCIEDTVFTRFVRKMMISGGAEFQQVVLHDPSSIRDTYVTVRRKGNYFLHNGGIYLYPWDFQKTVLHWDIHDCRPMEDKSPQAKWESPKMNSRYFYGIVNSVSMNKDKEDINILMKYILYAIGAMIIIGLYNAYTSYQFNQDMLSTLSNMNNTIPRY